MIIDRLTNADTYRALGSGVSAAFDFLCSADLAELEPGRHELPNGIYAIVSEYETVAPESKQWEAHRKFIDVQYVVSGAELIGYAPLDTLAPVAGYDEGGDAIMLSGSGGFLPLTAGTFAVFYPQDAHMPGVAAESKSIVRKVVVKVPV